MVATIGAVCKRYHTTDAAVLHGCAYIWMAFCTEPWYWVEATVVSTSLVPNFTRLPALRVVVLVISWSPRTITLETLVTLTVAALLHSFATIVSSTVITVAVGTVEADTV